MEQKDPETNSQLPPEGYHVNLEGLTEESSSIESLEGSTTEMETIDVDKIDWNAVYSFHRQLIQEEEGNDYNDDIDDEDEDYNIDDEDIDEDIDDESEESGPIKRTIDWGRKEWNEILKYEKSPDFFLKVCEFHKKSYGNTTLQRESYNKLQCYRIDTSNAKLFKDTVMTLIENYQMFGVSYLSNKPYSHASSQDNYWRLLKDAKEKVRMRPSLLDNQTKQILENLLAKKEQSGLWYKIKKLFGKV